MKYTTLTLSLFIFTQSGTLYPQELIAHPAPINSQWPSYVAGAALLGTTAWVGCYLYKKHTRKWQRKYVADLKEFVQHVEKEACERRLLVLDENKRHEFPERSEQLQSQPQHVKVTKDDLFKSVEKEELNALVGQIFCIQDDTTWLIEERENLLKYAIDCFSKSPTDKRKHIISFLLISGIKPTETHRMHAIKTGIIDREVLTNLGCSQQTQPQPSPMVVTKQNLFTSVQDGKLSLLINQIRLFQDDITKITQRTKDLLRHALHFFSLDPTQSDRKSIISLLITNGFQPTKVHRERAIAKKITDPEILELLGCPPLLIEAIQNKQEDLILYAINAFTPERSEEIRAMIQLLVNSGTPFTQAHREHALSKEEVTSQIIDSWTSRS